MSRLSVMKKPKKRERPQEQEIWNALKPLGWELGSGSAHHREFIYKHEIACVDYIMPVEDKSSGKRDGHFYMSFPLPEGRFFTTCVSVMVYFNSEGGAYIERVDVEGNHPEIPELEYEDEDDDDGYQPSFCLGSIAELPVIECISKIPELLRHTHAGTLNLPMEWFERRTDAYIRASLNGGADRDIF